MQEVDERRGLEEPHFYRYSTVHSSLPRARGLLQIDYRVASGNGICPGSLLYGYPVPVHSAVRPHQSRRKMATFGCGCAGVSESHYRCPHHQLHVQHPVLLHGASDWSSFYCQPLMESATENSSRAAKKAFPI